MNKALVIVVAVLVATLLATVVAYERASTPVRQVHISGGETQQAPPPPPSLDKRVAMAEAEKLDLVKIIRDRVAKLNGSIKTTILPYWEGEKPVGWCVVYNFAKNPVWVETSYLDLKTRKVTRFIGWLGGLTVCIAEKKGKPVLAGITISEPVKPPGKELPPYASEEAKKLAKKVIELAENYLAEHVNLSPRNLRISFWGIENDIAFVSAEPAKNIHPSFIILIKIDTKNMKIIEATEYPLTRVYTTTTPSKG